MGYARLLHELPGQESNLSRRGSEPRWRANTPPGIDVVVGYSRVSRCALARVLHDELGEQDSNLHNGIQRPAACR